MSFKLFESCERSKCIYIELESKTEGKRTIINSERDRIIIQARSFALFAWYLNNSRPLFIRIKYIAQNKMNEERMLQHIHSLQSRAEW